MPLRHARGKPGAVDAATLLRLRLPPLCLRLVFTFVLRFEFAPSRLIVLCHFVAPSAVRRFSTSLCSRFSACKQIATTRPLHLQPSACSVRFSTLMFAASAARCHEIA